MQLSASQIRNMYLTPTSKPSKSTKVSSGESSVGWLQTLTVKIPGFVKWYVAAENVIGLHCCFCRNSPTCKDRKTKLNWRFSASYRSLRTLCQKHSCHVFFTFARRFDEALTSEIVQTTSVMSSLCQTRHNKLQYIPSIATLHQRLETEKDECDTVRTSECAKAADSVNTMKQCAFTKSAK